MPDLRSEVRGRGWSLSVQRWRAVPAPPLSSNLGAAALRPLAGRAAVRRLAVRLAEGERFWIAIESRRDVPVSGTLADGRTLQDEIAADPGGKTVLHRLARIAGEQAEGIGREQAPVFHGPDADGYSAAVSIGRRMQVHLCLVDAAAFDTNFGAPPAGAGPEVYGGWRLP